MSDLKIITYPHPTLRRVSKPLRRVDADLRKKIRDMFELMYAAKGIGLAANQVDLPLRFFIVNLEAKPDAGEEMVFINPVVSLPRGGSEEAEEGCLSLPGLYGQVTRPKQVRINAYSLDGQEITTDVTGLMARCVQHELDHLDGVLFPDRMSPSAKADIVEGLDEFEAEFRSRRDTGGIPTDDELAKQWADWESKYA
ncbi:MAG TPA: peptide deformylase [Pirellulaceae bacterium]